jgi:hypothetical protein
MNYSFSDTFQSVLQQAVISNRSSVSFGSSYAHYRLTLDEFARGEPVSLHLLQSRRSFKQLLPAAWRDSMDGGLSQLSWKRRRQRQLLDITPATRIEMSTSNTLELELAAQSADSPHKRHGTLAHVRESSRRLLRANERQLQLIVAQTEMPSEELGHQEMADR